ncbi:MAG: CPBP family intramembrane metalloprotease [Chloroflexi bacterium]|nr:CPBP family intramembrane metalloprotease [Chloroflexota bacterium]
MVKRRRRQPGARVNPYISLLLLVAIGVGTWKLEQPLRQTVLWLALLLAALVYVEARPVRASFSWTNVGWGVLIGVVASVPFMAFGWSRLPEFVATILGTSDGLLLFYQLVLVAAPLEELYFRGFVQRELGLPISIALYALVALVFFLPVPGLRIGDLALVVGLYAIIGLVQSYVYRRLGLSAAIASRVTINLLALVLPVAISSLSPLVQS